MTNPSGGPAPSPTALLDRLDIELADLGARLARVRDDLGGLRGAPTATPAREPLPSAVPPAAPPRPAAPPP
ncbi:hypothetical protein ACFPBZ_19900, partial [Actinomycetospora atypica]